MICDRCGEPTRFFTTSRFNLDDVCPTCLSDEKAAPGYQRAFETEAAMVRLGNLNFPGIGLSPEDHAFLTACRLFRRSFRDNYPLGQPVQLVQLVERYPHGVWGRGTRGRMAIIRPDIIAVKLDDRYEALREWNNSLHWYPQNGDENTDLAAFFREVEPIKAEVL